MLMVSVGMSLSPPQRLDNTGNNADSSKVSFQL
jgi:hypothetical protein